jgi:hypothetical protein
MVGVVTTRHLLTHSAVIVHEFGALCFYRCLWRTLTAEHAVTFLECANPIRGGPTCPRATPPAGIEPKGVHLASVAGSGGTRGNATGLPRA